MGIISLNNLLDLFIKILMKNQSTLILFLCCIISRTYTSIYYIEDIDSLRFALSISDQFNLSKFQPHFPGYPVFWFLAKIFYLLTGNMGISFSIIGGISTFFIIFYSLKILNLNIESVVGVFSTLIIFFNPMIWILGNRYMPDLMGLAIFICTLYFLLQHRNKKIGCFLIGLLFGTRLSFFPLILIPLLFSFKNQKNKISLFNYLIFGCLIWLIPMIYITGFNEIFSLASKHTIGHFTEYGGTVITESNWLKRFTLFFSTIWSDGLGGYWKNRSLVTMVYSILVVPIIYMGIKSSKIKDYNIKVLYNSVLIYIIWILFFQNIIYKSRHVLPIVFILILFVCLGIQYIVKNYSKYKNIYYTYLSGLIVSLLVISLTLNFQHKNHTAISQLSNYLINKQPKTIVSIPLINYYLKSHGIKGHFINIENEEELLNIDFDSISNDFYLIGDFKNFINKDFLINTEKRFYHNPYVNRMWSIIELHYVQK